MLKLNEKKTKQQNIEKGRFSYIQMNGDYFRDCLDRYRKRLTAKHGLAETCPWTDLASPSSSRYVNTFQYQGLALPNQWETYVYACWIYQKINNHKQIVYLQGLVLLPRTKVNATFSSMHCFPYHYWHINSICSRRLESRSFRRTFRPRNIWRRYRGSNHRSHRMNRHCHRCSNWHSCWECLH